MPPAGDEYTKLKHSNSNTFVLARGYLPCIPGSRHPKTSTDPPFTFLLKYYTIIMEPLVQYVVLSSWTYNTCRACLQPTTNMQNSKPTPYKLNL